jgi:hypothetical protein
LPNPSPYLAAAQSRWADRGALVLQDVDILLEGLRLKGHLLDGLREKIQEHRRQDAEQLETAREEDWSRWKDRILRIEEWRASAAPLKQSSDILLAWKTNGRLFERADGISLRLHPVLTRRIDRLEGRLTDAAERTRQWSDRILVKELELREFMERKTDSFPEILVPAYFKRSFLDFLFAEREEEGQLAVELKNIGAETGRALMRLSRTAEKLSKRAEIHPAYFEIRKSQILETWRPAQQQLMQISQQTLSHGLVLEESRQRLRGIYEVVQRMKMVEVPPPRRWPLLHRLFNIRED